MYDTEGYWIYLHVMFKALFHSKKWDDIVYMQILGRRKHILKSICE